MAIMELLQDLPGIRGTLAREKLESWTSYSNINYSLVGIMIEALWGGSLNNFMQETLFKPFGMHSTTIGYETNQGVHAGRYLVDSRSNMHPATNLNYRSTGAEAAALGGYTTTHDMDRFLGTLLSAFSNNRAISYITAKFVNESLLQMENERTGDTVHTALGLYTELDSFVIGSLSVNRLLYPDAEFSTYRTAPKATWPQKKTEVYYMAGSAAGCGSASAFMPGGDDKNFAVTVLSNTSGPVDPSDHILRLILRRLANVKERKAGTGITH